MNMTTSIPVERRKKPRLSGTSGTKHMSNAELDQAIAELSQKVATLIAERTARHTEATEGSLPTGK